MPKTIKTNLLSDTVSVSRQFLRSVNLEADLGRTDALQGYVCQDTARSLLGNMAHHINKTRQRAFTWTGPYGGGKSSLALVLGSLVSPTKSLRDEAKKILGLSSDAPRWRIDDLGKLTVEAAMPANVVEGLKNRGHEVTVMPTNSLDFGSAQAIAKISDGADSAYIAGSDHRRDGLAAGF